MLGQVLGKGPCVDDVLKTEAACNKTFQCFSRGDEPNSLSRNIQGM